MSDTEGYTIRARIRVDDAAGTGAASVGQKLKNIEAEGQRVSFSLSSMLQKAFLFAGGASGLGMLAKGIVGLNAPLQEASYGMATLLSAQTGVGINQALGVAKSLVGDLRKDAAAGAGELSNYTEGLQMLLGPGLGAGASLQQIRELNRLALGAGFALRGQEGLRYAPMDIQQALTQGTGDRTTPIVNQALNAVGMSQAAFNKLDPAKKIEALTKAFQAFGPGVELMGKSWSAQMSTLQDKLKGIGAAVTAPLFDRWSEQLGKVNGWLTKNADQMGEIADRWGGKLVALWDHLVRQAGTYAALVGAAAVAQNLPAISGSAKSAYGAVQGGMGVLGAALKDPLGLEKTLAVGLGQSAAGLTGGVGPLLEGLSAGLNAVAAPLIVVTAGFLAVKGAMSEFPETLAFVAVQAGYLWQSLQDLGDSFGMLTDPGSPLNLLGAALIGIFGGVVWAGTQVVKIFASLVTGLAVVLSTVAYGLKSLVMLANGDYSGASIASDMAAAALVKGQDQLSKIWMGTPEKEKFDWQGPTQDLAGKLPKNKPPPININGPVKFELKTEQNTDPARVMSAFSEGVDRLSRFATQSRRRTVPMPG